MFFARLDPVPQSKFTVSPSKTAETLFAGPLVPTWIPLGTSPAPWLFILKLGELFVTMLVVSVVPPTALAVL